MAEQPKKLYGYVCGNSVHSTSRSSMINFISMNGIMSNNNIGQTNEHGVPLKLRNEIPIKFTENIPQHIPENCPASTLISIDFEQSIAYLKTKYNDITLQFDDKTKVYTLGRDCKNQISDDGGSWFKPNDETECAFTLRPDLFKFTDTAGNDAVIRMTSSYNPKTWTDPKTKVNWISRLPLQTVQNYIENKGIDPKDWLSYKKLAYYTFNHTWKQNLKERVETIGKSFSMNDWDAKFPNYMAWKDRVGIDMPSVSMFAHTMINPPVQDPRTILDYAAEVETDWEAIDDWYWNNSHYDLSQVQEMQTSPFKTVEEVINSESRMKDPETGHVTRFKMKDLIYIQHGHGPTGNGNGSHLHIRPMTYEPTDRMSTTGLEHIYYRTYRSLIGMFAPFFAGTFYYMDNRDDFRIRDPIARWGNVPPIISQDQINNWRKKIPNPDNQEDGCMKTWWITPHTKASHTSQKPLTFEFRVNEALPQSGFTAIRLMGRIADAFDDAGLVPVWSNNLLNLSADSIPQRKIRRLKDLKAVLTEDPITAEIVSKVLGKEIKAGDIVSLTDILQSSLKTMPMRPWEKFWAYNVLGGVTWSKVLREVYNNHNQNYHNPSFIKSAMKTTRQFLNFFPERFDLTEEQIKNPNVSVESFLNTPGLIQESTSNYTTSREAGRTGPRGRSQRSSNSSRDDDECSCDDCGDYEEGSHCWDVCECDN